MIACDGKLTIIDKTKRDAMEKVCPYRNISTTECTEIRLICKTAESVHSGKTKDRELRIGTQTYKADRKLCGTRGRRDQKRSAPNTQFVFLA